MEPDELVRLLQETTPNPGWTPPTPDERSDEGEPGIDRAWVALMLAPTPDIWQALLDGQPVDPACLDQEWLARLRKLGAL